MDKQYRKMKRWFCGLLIAVSLAVAVIVTIRKAMEIRQSIQYDIARNAALGENGLWTQYEKEYYERYSDPQFSYKKDGRKVRDTSAVATAAAYAVLANCSYKFYNGPADYPNSVGIGIAPVNPDGTEIKLAKNFLALNEQKNDRVVQLFAIFDNYDFLEDEHRFYRSYLQNTYWSRTCRDMLGSHSPITLVGKRSNGLVIVTELTIHYILSYGDDGEPDTENIVITFPRSANAEGEDYVFSSWEGDVERGLITDSELHDTSECQLCGNEEYNSFCSLKDDEALWLCQEAKALLMERPLLGLDYDKYPIYQEEGNGLFTLTMQYNYTDEVIHDEAFQERQGVTFAVLFVAHPFRLAVKSLVSIYVIILLVLAVAIGFFLSRINHLQKVQEKYERSRLAMTHNTAHELKTPLAVARNYAVALAEGKGDAEAREAKAKGMVEQIDQISSLVEDLLELSRLEAEARVPVPENIDLTSLTNALLEQLEPMAKYRLVTVDAPKGECLVSADLSMMRTVLMNFLTNAARYSRSCITVTVTKEKKLIRWSVSNDGTVIPAEDLTHVWDAFFTVDESRSKEKGGTGLGLAIARQILELHKAKYGCTSDEKETVFFFEMPEAVETEDGTEEGIAEDTTEETTE